MNLKKFKINKLAIFIDKQTWIIFSFFVVLIFFLFADLFNSYFEADEWFHFTYYFPLTGKPDGFLTAIVSTIINFGPLSGGQHVVPVASAIYFLNTKFFGMNYALYAFMSLFFHAVNSFLVFAFIKVLLSKKDIITKNIFAILGGLFFALSPQPLHTITGASPFYGQNILSVTFFLLCVISFKQAYISKAKKFVYLSVFFLFLALFTKETAVFLFLLLPFMALVEKRIFPFKFLLKVFAISLVVYLIFRFVIPNFHTLPGKIIDKFVEGYIPKSYTQPAKTVDTGTIVSTDLSIHKNLPAEILFRAITFPVKMTGTLFLPRQTVFSIVQFITPIVQPVPPGGDSADSSQARLTFLYGPGNGFIIYIVSLVILIFCAGQTFRFVQRRQIQEAQALSTGLVIIILGALPLVAIIFSFPRWGYDFYFDSRFNYNPNVGAALVFPFLILGIVNFLSKAIRRETFFPTIAILVFIVWLVNNMFVVNLVLKQFVNKYSKDRKELVIQLKQHLPKLPKKAVFYTETDGLSAYGPTLPFQTSVPQALTVVYYDTSPLPDSFFDKPLFNGKGQGYMYSDGRGFGYYSSEKNLGEDLVAGKFEVSDIYGFFYEAEKVKVNDITSKIRSEMQDYLKDAKENSDWEKYSNPEGFSFLYPPNTQVTKTQETIHVVSPQFSSTIIYSTVLAGFDLNEYLRIREHGVPSELIQKKVNFDKFHYNDAVVIIGQSKREYFVKLNDKLIKLETYNADNESLLIIEKILGSIELIEQK